MFTSDYKPTVKFIPKTFGNPVTKTLNFNINAWFDVCIFTDVNNTH